VTFKECIQNIARKIGGKISFGRKRRNWNKNFSMDLIIINNLMSNRLVWLRIRAVCGLLVTQ
jgi:hypothetical protein